MKKQLNTEYQLIPEGEQVVHITKIDESQYDKLGKLTLIIEDEMGITACVNFNFITSDGKVNDIADSIYTRMCRAILNDQTLDECDTNDLIGKYVKVEIQHSEGTNGGVFANVRKWIGTDEPSSSTSKKALLQKKSIADILAEMKDRKSTTNR